MFGLGLALMVSASTPHRAAGSGPDALTALQPGQERHGFAAQALFAGLAGAPMGARFVHRTGAIVDVLFFASVPQVSIKLSSVPVSDRGEPHTLEHLVLGKGGSGKYLETLLEMRLALSSAGTDVGHTTYQFRSAAGPEGFREVLAQYLTTLIQPDFTDEEVRREVAHLGVAEGPDGRLALAEKGTVYNEMVATSDRPGQRQWRKVQQLVCGPGHPLARNSGGDPAGLWELGPESIRRFHAANYRVGPGFEMVAALPAAWSADEFLQTLDPLLQRLAAGQGDQAPAPLPPCRAASPPETWIGTYPSDSADQPQDVWLAWPSRPDLTLDEWDTLEILLEVIGGDEASYLHRDLVDQKSRVLDLAFTGVSAGYLPPPFDFPWVYLGGLPATSVQPGPLEASREAVVKRFRWLADLPDGSPGLVELSARARSRLSASRRAYRKFLDDPPNFGNRRINTRWHERLALAARAPGFAKPLTPVALYARLESEMAAGRNPWRSVVRRAGLDQLPHVVTTRPDPALAEQDKRETAARLERRQSEIAARLGGGDAQRGLAALQADYDARTVELEARDRTVPRPEFVRDPPLALDDVPFEQGRLASGAPLVRVHFGTTPFTDVALAFDLAAVPARDRIFLPLLPLALSRTGVTTRGGEHLDYARARERRDAEIYGFDVTPVGNSATGRHELEVLSSASSAEEIPRAVEWMENHLRRPAIGPGARERLVDLCREEIQAGRTLLQAPEETWAMDLAAAFRYQGDGLHQALASPFTRLRLLTRLRWRLEDPAPPARRAMEAELAAVTGLLAAKAERPAVTARVESVAGELGETLRHELSLLPDDRWREDLAEVARDLRADLDAGSASVLEGLQRVSARVFVRRGARARITASRENAETAVRLLDGLLAGLPAGRARAAGRPAVSAVHARLEQRYGRLAPPVHVGFVKRDAKSGVHVVRAAGPSYASGSRDDALDVLAVGMFAGGPHSLFMQTWSAGLAYSNGLNLSLGRGETRYYAERCPDLVQTLQFVDGIVAKASLDDPALLQNSLATAFHDFRGTDDFSSRGAGLAADLADGITPEQVAAFKRLVLATAREPEALSRVRQRVPEAVGRVLVGYGRPVAASPRALAFVIGPEELLAGYEAFLKEQGEALRLVRLYPRDFWPLPDAPPARAARARRSGRR